jgi:arylsulfatase A-like enzyme
MKSSAIVAALIASLFVSSGSAAAARPTLTIVLVIDGLRPDSINAEAAPNLARLQSEGISYNHAHSVYPTVTRVNATSISTGALPAQHGIHGNSLYVPEVSPRLLNTADYLSLLKLGQSHGGRVTPLTTLGEELERSGIRYVAMGSGSTGASLLLNHLAPSGKGSLINPGFENGKRVAFPDSLNRELLRRFPPVKETTEGAALIWTEQALREYVLPEMHPQVIVDWMSPTDGAQHAHGVGSPEALAALRLVDRQIGLLRERLGQLGLKDTTNIIVTCDHGFDYEPAGDVLAPVQADLAGNEIVVDNEGGGSFLYFKDHDPQKIQRLAEGLQQSDKTNAIFVAARRPERGTFQCSADATKGWLPGTFALDLAYQCSPQHGPDLIVTYHWDNTRNPFGAPGTQLVPGKPVPGQPVHSGHGGLNPWVTRSTLLLSGPNFRHRATSDVPAGNQDIAPTVLSIEGLPIPQSMQGRVLAEAIDQQEKVTVPTSRTERLEVSRGTYCALIEVSSIGAHRYLNYGSRCADVAPSAAH